MFFNKIQNEDFLVGAGEKNTIELSTKGGEL
jgi:hypothetical protein